MTEAELTAVLTALADPVRRAILDQLAKRDATVGELAAPLELGLPSVSKHVKVLAEAGLVRQRRDAQRRICRLDPQPLADMVAWAEEFRRHWERTYQHDGDLLDLIPAPEHQPR